MHIYDIVTLVSQEHLLQNINLQHNRSCNVLTRFDIALVILPLIGIQDRPSRLTDNEVLTLSLQAFC